MLSQTAEYALRAMSCLAYQPDELTPTPKLASMTRVPSNYLAKVLQLLSQADLIHGRRGVGGGYKLSKPAEEIALLDVVNAVTEITRIDGCPLGLPNHGQLCRLHAIVDQASARVIETFENVSLGDLVGPHHETLPLCNAEFTEQIRMSLEGAAPVAAPATNGNGAHAHSPAPNAVESPGPVSDS